VPPFCDSSDAKSPQIPADAPESSLAAAATGLQPPDGIAASLCSTATRTNSLLCEAQRYGGDSLLKAMPLRTKREGAEVWNPETTGSFTTTTHFLLLTRPVRCREGQTADDAVLTLIFLILKLSSEQERH
jgi:hypothetical protein